MASSILKSRIGLEIFLLASLIASVPLLVISAFSLDRIYTAFDERNSEYLATTAETHGRTVLERLRLIASLVRADQGQGLVGAAVALAGDGAGRLARLRPGDAIKISVQRKNQSLDLRAIVGALNQSINP